MWLMCCLCVACVLFVCGMCMACVWFVCSLCIAFYGLSMVFVYHGLSIDCV